MSAYKRFVSYIFSYENGVKKDNVGYARIENYNDQCRINIYMKDAVKRDQKASVYLFYREQDKIQGIFMNEITIKNGFGDCKIVTESEHIGGTSCSFDQIGGIIIYITANRFWGTEWDDKPIFGFEPSRNWKQETTVEVSQEDKTGFVVPKVKIEESEEIEQKQRESDFEEAKEAAEKSEQKAEMAEPELEAAVIRQPVEETDCFAPYTKVYPFYEQDRECIGVTPKELTEISPILEEWQKNHFVLYGYERFRHILLLRKKGKIEKYFIGVPGMYRPSEEKMASAYGFSMFVPMRKEKAEHGDFGYFCAEVEME